MPAFLSDEMTGYDNDGDREAGEAGGPAAARRPHAAPRGDGEPRGGSVTPRLREEIKEKHPSRKHEAA